MPKWLIKLDLLRDIDILLMFEKGIWGGNTQTLKRYAKVKSKYIRDQNNSDVKTTYLQYLDANNLYWWEMIQQLLTHRFGWEKVNVLLLDEIVKKRQDRVYFRGQWRCRVELHKSHNKLPFLAERIKIGKVEKLDPSLKFKMTYKVHIKNLNQSLRHDRKFNKKVHWIICFEQSSWMRRLLIINTKLRTAAKNEFEKAFFNLLNNRIFSKTTENIRSHMLREKHFKL